MTGYPVNIIIMYSLTNVKFDAVECCHNQWTDHYHKPSKTQWNS